MANGSTRIQPLDDVDYKLHSNACHDLIKYVRSNTIRNEQPFLLTTLGYLTGLFDETDHYISGVLIGTSSSGKTHLQQKVENLFHPDMLYQATTGSDKAFIYDEEWDHRYIASLDELQKPSQEVIEFLKGVHGGDEGHDHKTTMGSTQEGYHTETTSREAKPYWMLYAQYDSDFELWNRLLKVPVHESESKNIAVGAMAFDHDHIQVGDDVEYGYGFSDGSLSIQEHIIQIERKVHNNEIPGYVHLPTGDEYGWDVWEVVEPIFNHSRSESNRIYEMVANLIRASALFNYFNRDIEEIYHSQHGTIDAIIADPQDVANVLACRETLLSTTHNLDDKRWAITEAIKTKGGAADEVEGYGPITEHLKESDAPLPPESELENLLEDLSDNYLIDIHPGAGDKGRDMYEFLGYDQLGFGRVLENEKLFDETFDPISGRRFVDVHRELRDRLESRGADMIGEIDESNPSSTGGSGREQGLGAYGGGGGRGVELEPHEEKVRSAMKDHLDGERIRDLTSVPVEGLIGLTDFNDPEDGVDHDGTILDPDNEVWAQADKANSWVSSTKDAKREVRRAIKQLVSEQVVTYPEVHERTDEGKPIDATVSVLSEGEL